MLKTDYVDPIFLSDHLILWFHSCVDHCDDFNSHTLVNCDVIKIVILDD